jgi:hypothetical protein
VGIAAPSVLGLAFPLFLLDRDRKAWAAVQAPVMLGFGLADVYYFWAVLADVGSLHGVLKSFGFGLGLMVAAIGAGMWAVGQLVAGPGLQLGAAAVATAAIFLGATLGGGRTGDPGADAGRSAAAGEAGLSAGGLRPDGAGAGGGPAPAGRGRV